MSAKELGRLIDESHAGGGYIHESEHSVTISNLSVEQARGIASACTEPDFTCRIYDAERTGWNLDDLKDEFAPFRVVVTKPALSDGSVPVLSAHGFRQLLLEPEVVGTRWLIIGLGAPIRTWSTSFLPWGSTEAKPSLLASKNPRFFVKEFTAERAVPDDVGKWLLRDPDKNLGVSDGFRSTWAEVATGALLACLPNEIDVENGELKFRGPPRLALTKPAPSDVQEFAAGTGFTDLQIAATWVFENIRDTETKHALLASEIARTGRGFGAATVVLKEDLKAALEGARLAFEMSLTSIGTDTLKALSDLRKAVTEETAKVTEATRQTVAAVASSLAVGIGLLAAKMTTTVHPLVVGALMVVASIYVTMVVLSGWQFVSLQKDARETWQHRLYRFLPKAEYERLVVEPTSKAERAFRVAAVLGLSAVAFLSAALWLSASPNP